MQLQAQGIEKGAAGYQQALPILDAICQADPENVEALETVVRCRRAARMDISQEALGNLVALGGRTSKKDTAAGLVTVAVPVPPGFNLRAI